MSKPKCKRSKCKYYRKDWDDGLGIGCERHDENVICIRELNEDWSIGDFFESIKAVKND